jgi:hypothetical protein
MNASDLVRARQNKTLFQAYYQPTIFPGLAGSNSTLIVSTVNRCPISSISGSTTSYTAYCSTQNYLSKCLPTSISYELLNDVNSGKYVCGYPACSSITKWNTPNTTYVTGVCGCNISYTTWSANQAMGAMTTYAQNGSTLSSSNNSYTVKPIICINPQFYQGTNFDNRCNGCNNVLGVNNCCNTCVSG